MRIRFSLAVLAALLFLPALLRAQFTYTTIDPPGSTYTQAMGVSGANIVGYYIDSGSVYHGFLYNGGTYTTIDPPGSTGTAALAVSGTVLVGYYADSNGVRHGFSYDSGSYTTFDPPGSVTTTAQAVSGAIIAGTFRDTTEHGFIVNGGSITVLDAPGAVGTIASGISGTNVTGYYVDNNGTPHGFLYDIGMATFTPLDPPSTTNTQGAAAAGNNVGGFFTDNHFTIHGFLYNGGTYTVIDPPGASSTEVLGAGGPDLVGYYLDGASNQHGFIYNGGGYTSFDVTGGDTPMPVGISGNNVVGYYKINFHTHGFLLNLGGGGANLSGLALSIGKLSPAFSKATLAYTTSVPYGASSMTISPTAVDPTATVTVNSTPVPSGGTSDPISLSPGSNTITVVVTSSDGTTTQTYTVTVNRAAGLVTVPTDLPANSQYRLVFVTDGTRDATSSTIGDYNQFVTTEASTSPALSLLGTNWTAICSIENLSGKPVIVAAIDNTSTHGTGVPIYGLDGSLVAANYTALWGNHLSSGIYISESGALESGMVWTGTNTTGVPSDGNENGSGGLTSTYPTVGLAGQSNSKCFDFGAPNFTEGVTLPMYAISGVLTVPYGPIDLSALTVSTGTPTPAFSNIVTSYSVSVPYTTSTIQVTPTAPIATSTVTVNGTTVASGAASGDISLTVGANSIPVVVTAQDGVTTRTYVITVNRAAPSTNANLAGLALGAATLSPAFSSGTTSYTAAVLNIVTSITVTPTVADATATVQVNGSPTVSGAATGAIALLPGQNTITVLVTAQDGTTTGTYTVVVTRAILPTVATLGATGVLGTGATFNGTVNANGANAAVSFAYGLTTAYGTTIAAVPATVTGTSNIPVSATVTKLLPSTTYHYQLLATNAGGTAPGLDASFTTPSNINTLASLKLSTGTLTPAFNGTTGSYTVTVPGTTPSLTFTPTSTTGSIETVTVNGASVGSGSASAAIALSPGINVIPVVVTAQDGVTARTYTITVTQSTPPTATTLAATGLTTTIANLNGTINANGTSTAASFVYGLTNTYGSTMSATPSTVTGGTTVAVTAKLTGLKAATTYHYQVKGVSTAGTNTGGDMMFTTPASNALPTVTTAAAVVPNGTTATFNGTVNANNESTVTSFDYGTGLSYGTTVAATPSPLTDNNTTPVSATVSTLKPGTLYHFRAKGINAGGTGYGPDMTFTTPNNVATLSALVLSTGTLSPAFSSSTTSYTATVSVNTGSVTVKPTITLNSNAVVTVNGAVVASGTASTAQTLSYGANTIPVVVTAQDGTFKTYTLVITRASAPPVSTLAATGVTATGATFKGLATTNGASTTVSFDYGTSTTYGSTVAATPSPVTGLGVTAVSATVSTLKPATTYHYRTKGVNVAGTTNGVDVTFTTLNNVATLSALVLSTGTLSPGFSGTTTSYTAAVTAATASITVKPTLSDTHATVTVNGIAVASGTASGAIALSPGLNPITIAVTAADMTTIKTYSVTVVRPETATAVTGVATGLAATGATLNGTINANGTSTTASFSYGLTNTYGSTATAMPSPVTGGATVAVSAKLTSLKPSTTYHFQVKGVSTTGTSTGADAMFTTPPTPVLATVSTQPASAVTTTTATLNGTATANNFDATLSFDYGTTTAYGKNIAATPATATGATSTPFGTMIAGLTPGTLYHYRAKGVNAAGTTLGLDASFTTTSTVATLASLRLSTGTLSPAFTTATTAYLATVPNTTAALTVTPTVTTNSHATVTVNGAAVVSGAASASIALAPGVNNITVTVTAQDGVTMVSYSVRVTRTTPAPVVATQAATGVDANDATLQGTVNANGTNAAASFDYGLTTAYGSSIAATPTPVTGTTVTPVTASLTNLQPSTTYHYRTSASNAGGLSSGLDAVFTTPAHAQKKKPAVTAAKTPAPTPAPDKTPGADTTTAAAASTPAPAAAPAAPPAPVPIKAQLTGPVENGGALPGAAAAFTWNAGRGVTSYSLSAGTTVGGADLYAGTASLALNATVTLPTDGEAIYVTLYSMINGQPQANNYVFTAADTTKAVLTTPPDQSVLTGDPAVFTWGSIPGATEYWLSIGSTAGATDLYDASAGTALTQTVSLPTDGRQLFVALKTSINGQWLASNSTLTASGSATAPAASVSGNTATAPSTASGTAAAQLTSPVDHAVLPGSPVTFTWNTGAGVSEYWLSVGSSTVATDLYDASQGANQTVTIAIPADGSPVYVTISSRINGQWQSNQYLYQAALPP